MIEVFTWACVAGSFIMSALAVRNVMRADRYLKRANAAVAEMERRRNA